MSFSRPLSVALLAATLALPAGATATASAAASTATAPVSAATSDSTVALALSVAARYWKAVPCQGGQVTVIVRQSLPKQLDAGSDAWVTFGSSLGANNLTAPAASYSNCTIAFGRTRWPTAVSLKQDWDMFCMTMTHELGHLLGHPHDLTPGSVMAPVFTDYSDEPQLCRTTRPSGSRR